MSTHKLNAETLDPNYIQVSRKRAAEILGVSLATFNRLRVSDPNCPTGYRHGNGRNVAVTFRLSDIYQYSEHRMKEAETA